jgi:hypothetical protein
MVSWACGVLESLELQPRAQPQNASSITTFVPACVTFTTSDADRSKAYAEADAWRSAAIGGAPGLTGKAGFHAATNSAGGRYGT